MATEGPQAAKPERCVLDGVPRVGFYPDMQQHKDSMMRCPEDVCFPSCLRACLEFLGDGLGCRKIGTVNTALGISCGYAYLMGTTGAAFRLNWKPGWHGDNVATFLVSDDPSEIFRRGFASVGRECEVFCRSQMRREGWDSVEFLRERIIESIRDSKRPVIAHGIIGPPEECLVTGYDQGGDVLIGWSFFQSSPDCNAGIEFEPNGQFRKRDWEEDLASLLVIGDRMEEPLKPDEIFRDSLRFALDVVHTPLRYGDRHNGLAAYDAWVEHLLWAEEFDTDDIGVLMQRLAVHDDAVGTVAEGRWYASLFLTQAASNAYLPASPLYRAAACYAREHDLMWEVWQQVGGIGRSPEKARELAKPKVRRRIVPIIREARALDAEAAKHIEQALG